MNINKKIAFLIAYSMMHSALAGSDGPNEDQVPARLLLPIHLLIDDDETGDNKPANEPGIDYNIYRVGNAEWPDWDWSDPRLIAREEEKISHKKATGPMKKKKINPQLSSEPDIQISADASAPPSPQPQSTLSMLYRLLAYWLSSTK